VDSSGNIFIADFGGNRIRKVSSSGVITTVAGNGLLSFSGDGGQVNSARIYGPGGTALDATGNLYFADSGNFRIRKVSTTGIITTIAGNGTQGFSGDGGPAISATFNGLGDIAIDGAGNLYIVDFIRVRKVTPQGIITTVAGTNTTGYSGDGGPAVNAVLNYPAGIAVDSTGNVGNVYIADQRNNRIRKVISSTGIITTVAGNGTAAYSGDGGTAINASLNSPAGIALDNSGNLYVADQGNNRIRMVSSAGTITTIAGNGTVGFSGNGGSALNASLRSPIAVTVDSKGSIYLLDSFAGSNGIRLSAISTAGVITTIAGIANSSLYTLTPDGAPATSVGISASAVTVDVSGNLYISEVYPNVIRVLRPVNQSVLISAVVDAASSMAGSISPGKIVVIYGGGLGPSTLAQFQVSNGLVGTQLAGTTVSFNGTAAPVIYSSATQVAAIVPYQIAGTTAQVTVSYQGQSSTAFTVPFAAAAPGLFSLNQTGAGQAAAINIADGTVNTAANPVKIGGYISLFATGEGQTTPAGVDGKVASGSVLPAPTLKVSVMVGGIPATVQYAGAAPGDVAGVMQVNVQIPAGVQPGGYVPVLLQVGSATTTTGAAWIAVAGN
jgi:uncharacterized protein (TIGR03437 family)